MVKQVITVPNTPATLPFSPAIKAGDYIFVSGQIGTPDDKGRKVKETEAQTRQCLENMKRILEAAGSSASDVVKVTVFLVNADDFAEMNQAYRSYFPKDPPARATVITGLARADLLVEMDCIAYRP